MNLEEVRKVISYMNDITSSWLIKLRWEHSYIHSDSIFLRFTMDDIDITKQHIISNKLDNNNIPYRITQSMNNNVMYVNIEYVFNIIKKEERDKKINKLLNG